MSHVSMWTVAFLNSNRFTVQIYEDGLICIDVIQPRDNPLIKVPLETP